MYSHFVRRQALCHSRPFEKPLSAGSEPHGPTAACKSLPALLRTVQEPPGPTVVVKSLTALLRTVQSLPALLRHARASRPYCGTQEHPGPTAALKSIPALLRPVQSDGAPPKNGGAHYRGCAPPRRRRTPARDPPWLFSRPWGRDRLRRRILRHGPQSGFPPHGRRTGSAGGFCGMGRKAVLLRMGAGRRSARRWAAGRHGPSVGLNPSPVHRVLEAGHRVCGDRRHGPPGDAPLRGLRLAARMRPRRMRGAVSVFFWSCSLWPSRCRRFQVGPPARRRKPAKTAGFLTIYTKKKFLNAAKFAAGIFF